MFEETDGVIAEGSWLAASNNRTRDEHLDADGQIVPVDGTFLGDGEQLNHPGDKSASVELWIQFRCTVARIFARDGRGRLVTTLISNITAEDLEDDAIVLVGLLVVVGSIDPADDQEV